MKLKVLVGNGRKIGLLTLPFLIVGITMNIMFPGFFFVNGTSGLLFPVSIVILAVGVVDWAWTVVLIITKIPKRQLITTGPYAIIKHPLYDGVALLVLPWAGFLLNTWLGVVIGIVVFIGSKIFSPEEERVLAKIFGSEWEAYCKKVWIPWL